MNENEEKWSKIEQMIKEINDRPVMDLKLKWWQRPFHKHETLFDGWIGFRYIERCRCSYGRIDNGRWFKF